VRVRTLNSWQRALKILKEINPTTLQMRSMSRIRNQSAFIGDERRERRAGRETERGELAGTPRRGFASPSLITNKQFYALSSFRISCYTHGTFDFSDCYLNLCAQAGGGARAVARK
jgi:hypothetical protein